jgi:hypothetical protein
MQLRLWPSARPEADRAREDRRTGPATLVALLLNVLIVAIVWQALDVPVALERVFLGSRPAIRPREQVDFVRMPPQPGLSVARPAAAAAPRATVPQPEVTPLIPPRDVPVGIPPAPAIPSTRPVVPGPVSGPIVGGAGPTRGVQPTFEDPRVWVPSPPLIYAPKTEEQRLDSALLASLERYRDSVARNTYSPNRFERGDWTVERGGQKWGLDQNYIRLGKISIPTALLALLPINRFQANPIAMERERSMAMMRADIMYHAQVALNEEEFRKAVRAIRDRKERERKAQQQRPLKPVTSPGDRPPQ